MGNFDNYYIDGNGNAHRDIPLGTSPADAYVRTNMKLKKEVQRIDSALQETNEHIETEISRVDEAVVNAVDGVSRQLESAVNDINESIEEVSDSIDTRIASLTANVNSRVDNIIAHNNDTEGNSELIDIRTGADHTVYATAGTAVRTQFQSINEHFGIVSPVWFDDTIGNLYDYHDDTYGYYINPQNGETIEQTGYYVTGYITVRPYKTIYKNYNGYGAFYDAEHNYISGHEYNVLSTVVPHNATYYRTAFATNNRTTAYISYTNEYTPYTGESVFNVTNNDFVEWLNNRYQAINAHNQRYAGKKIAVLGDSWSDTSNHTCTKRWHDWIAEKTGAVIQCAAVSGTGYKCGTDNDNTVSNFMQQALTIDSDTDLVIIFGSGNDCGTGSKTNFDFGTAKDKTADTLGGCMNITLDNIQRTAPNARILMLSPAPWINYDPWWEGAATGRMGVYTELMKNVAAYRGIRFKDMYHSSDMHPQNTDFRAAFYNSDGVHPNDAGQKRMYPDILAEIKAVLPESD